MKMDVEVKRVFKTLCDVMKKTLGRNGLHANVICNVPFCILQHVKVRLLTQENGAHRTHVLVYAPASHFLVLPVHEMPRVRLGRNSSESGCSGKRLISGSSSRNVCITRSAAKTADWLPLVILYKPLSSSPPSRCPGNATTAFLIRIAAKIITLFGLMSPMYCKMRPNNPFLLLSDA